MKFLQSKTFLATDAIATAAGIILVRFTTSMPNTLLTIFAIPLLIHLSLFFLNRAKGQLSKKTSTQSSEYPKSQHPHTLSAIKKTRKNRVFLYPYIAN
jgi:hypothetical protein